MTTPREICARLLAFFRHRQLDREFEQELAAHLDLATEDYIHQGLPPAEARRLALIKLGGLESSKDLHRDARGIPWLNGVTQDVRFALRSFAHSPAFALTALAILALGIGLNAAVFSVTNAVLFRGFPGVERPDRLVYLDHGGLSYQDYEDWKAQAKSFQSIAAVRGSGVILTDQNGFAESYDATGVTANTFALLGRAPILGRDFLPSDEIPGAPPVAILSYAFWQRRFHSDPNIAGRVLRINGFPTTIIGVMPENFAFPQKQDLWIPLPADRQKREARDLWVAVARLRDGVSLRSARAEMDLIGRRLESEYPISNQGFLPTVRSFGQFFVGPDVNMLYGSMWAAVACVLLIACANLANLMLARSIGRSREISVRIALGAGRWRIVRQLLIESAMLSAAGAFFGWWIAKLAIHAYTIAEWPPGARAWRVIDYSMDHRVLAYIAAVSALTCLLFGLAPAARLSRLDLNSALKDGARSTTGGRGKHLSTLLVIGEMAMAVVLLAGAGVLMRSFLNIYTAGVGVPTTGIFAASMALPIDQYPSPASRIAFYEQLKQRLETVPGVESVAIANRFPAGGWISLPSEIAGVPDPDLRPRTLFSLIIGPGYFRTLSARILAGREFQDFDGFSLTPAAIVNQRFADLYWPGANPLGRHLRVFDGTEPAPWLTVVGVVSNIYQDRARQLVEPLVYLPYRQAPVASMNVLARTRVPPATITNAFRHQVQTLDPDLPIFGPFSLSDRLAWSYWSSGLYGILFLIFASVALLLASIGLYAVVAHSVSRRTQEIGIRIAVGATASDILRLVFRQGMIPLAIGLVLGLALSFAVNPVLKAVLVRVSPADPVTYFAAAAALILAAALGCWIPARRAMGVDPLIALRHE